MKTLRKKLLFILLFPFAVWSQETRQGSISYQEMFPNNVDEVKLLVLLPSIMTMAEIEHQLPDLSPRDQAAAYESHVRRTERTIADIDKYIKKYKINCEMIKEADYNLKSFPRDSFPLVVYPEVVTVNDFHVSHAYRMKDVSNNIKYGYVMNREVTYTGQYFKQLNDYTQTLCANKKGQTNNIVLSEKIEEDVARKQRFTGKFRAIGIVVLISIIVVGVKVLGTR